MVAKGASQKEKWGVVRTVSRRLGPGKGKGEAVMHAGRVLVLARAKAEAFVRVYERVSRVKVPKGRGLKKDLNQHLRQHGPEQQDSIPITLSEVREALMDVDGGKAAGS